MNHRVNIGTISHSDLPENDYVSPGLAIIMPDRAFPNMIVGDISVPRWPYLRRWVEQNWYTDRRNPSAGFVNRDEASILYNSALLFRGKPCLEVGCWRGWSAVHLALGSGMLDIIDPVLGNPDFAESIIASCEAAGVLDKVTFHTGASPEAIHTLAQSSDKRWSLIFIDADHEGDAPRLDAEAAMLYATDTAMMLFHDLASPFVAAGLDAMRNAGWHTMVYQTMQIMGVAWRGNVQPVKHVPDPKVFWTLPRHLSGYEVSGWKASALPADGAAFAAMTMEDRRNAAMLRAQAAEDDLATALAERDAVLAERDQTAIQRDVALAERDQTVIQRDAALAERDQTAIQRDVALAER
ncbi:MAG: class I SAM-dependent methyltransferase, partial [Acetobacteraceae bacterium]|nr:class I SAM-dependent methyltransferase [Acetobacteraceae bacterium]